MIDELGLPENSIFVGMVGRYDLQKNHKGFIKTGKIVHHKFPNVHFILSGRDVSSTNITLVNAVKKNRLESVIHLLGYRENLADIYTALNIYVSASLFGEAFPLVLCEAMACGTCVLGSDIEGISEVIENNKTGLLVEPNNSDELLNKILYLLPKKEKRLSMANEGLERVKKYDWKIVGKLYLNFYESLLNKSI